MTKPAVEVGLLGANGMVGQQAVAWLQQQGISLRLGVRHPKHYPLDHLAESSHLQAVDINDTLSLLHFCRGCRLVLNCAGPSAWLGLPVAEAAAMAKAHLVDAFGGHWLAGQLQSVAAPGLLQVTGAGVFPGISERLPQLLAEQSFDQLDSLLAAAGGLERCSQAGGVDLIYSALVGYGSGAGQVRYQLDGFPAGICAQPYRSEDFQQLAHELGCPQAQWYSVFSSAQVPETIGRAVQKVSASSKLPSLQALERAAAKLIRVADYQLAGRQPWYRMVVEVSGQCRGEPRRQRAMLRSRNSYGLSGLMAALTAVSVLGGEHLPGLYRARQLVAAPMLINALQQSTDHTLDIVELPVEMDSAIIEEGCL